MNSSTPKNNVIHVNFKQPKRQRSKQRSKVLMYFASQKFSDHILTAFVITMSLVFLSIGVLAIIGILPFHHV